VGCLVLVLCWCVQWGVVGGDAVCRMCLMCVPLFRGKSVLVVHEMPLGGKESVCVVCCVVWMCGRCVDVWVLCGACIGFGGFWRMVCVLGLCVGCSCERFVCGVPLGVCMCACGVVVCGVLCSSVWL